MTIKSRISPEIEQQIKKLREEGYSQKDIGVKVNLSRQMVGKVLSTNPHPTKPKVKVDPDGFPIFKTVPIHRCPQCRHKVKKSPCIICTITENRKANKCQPSTSIPENTQSKSQEMIPTMQL